MDSLARNLEPLRSATIEQLLGKEAFQPEQGKIRAAFQGQTVLITGCGSIGAELCRQLAGYGPRKLLLLDISETKLVFLQQEMARFNPEVPVEPVVASVRDAARLAEVFAAHRPDIVFHTAGHKHISLMEAAPCEAIKNNVLAIYKVAYFALLHGCRRFYYMSMDKAVNPVNILGASSRLCELILQAFNQLVQNGQCAKLFPPCRETPMAARVGSEAPRTVFVPIRFGNLLDSDGSVMQLFRNQIAQGGPVTVSHRACTRFCMSVAEAVRRILQASTLESNGDVVVLDMGEPYRIDDLARKLIRLCGLEPDRDIAVQYIGLRPGERLYEELLMWEEGLRKTACPGIYIANSLPMKAPQFLQKLERYFKAVAADSQDARRQLSTLVNAYRPETPSAGTFEHAEIVKAQEPVNNLELISLKFQIQGAVQAVVPMTRGYINRTYRVDVALPDRTARSYTLQRINSNVFRDSRALMRNFALVTSHLHDHFRLPARPDRPASQSLVKTCDGRDYLEDPSGDWRMLTYFDRVHSYDVPETPEVFASAGQAFGAFLKAVASLEPAQLEEVIPNFHNTFSRYLDLEKAIERDPLGRVGAIQPEIDFVRARTTLFKKISEALAKGEIPLRIGHNDCNLNNVLFDDDTNDAVAVIDLDTVMPSTPLYDFGDAMRIGTNPARDDEKDLSKVYCDLNLYEQFARGWLSQCGKMLTPRERELLPYAALVITSEDGIRFLMDYIDGDTYYYTFYQGQNLDRARTQLALLADMERKLPKMKEILNSLLS